MKQNEENLNWEITTERFIVFLDIMGFKDFVMRRTHNDIYKMLSEISKIRTFIDQKTKNLEDEYYKDVIIETVSFSDSIILISNNNSPASFDLITFSTRYLFYKAIENQIPLKGAMAYGKLSVNKPEQIYFGQALIDAFQLEEELQYYGVIAHHTFVEYMANMKEKIRTYSLFYESLTPFKTGMISHTNLNWFSFNKDKEISIKERINIFKTKTSGSPRKYIDNTLKMLEDIPKN